MVPPIVFPAHSSSREGLNVIMARDSPPDTTTNQGSHPTLTTGKIAAMVVPIVLLLTGIIIGAIYAYRRRSQKVNILHEAQRPTTFSEKGNINFSTSNSQNTFIVALPTAKTTGQDITIGLGNDKPRVLYVAPGEDPSSAPLKKGSEIPPNLPTLKIDTSHLSSSPQGQTYSPSPSPRTAASKSPTALSDTTGKPYRMVIVDSTFPTSLPDELQIRPGEHLYLIEEYEDEWCLVQRVASKERGVVPRLCILEKERTPSAKIRNVFRFSAQAIAASKASRG
ncbi:hypothetical protein Clacol_006615 [Clathrus columnatus]|uniref:SH3 domain-containing protein n=1 Tax=Clathrus columnatus TaxID=1419009 RepID=A0AAV5ACJ8_9AGAM|nr:hypothetical protein Clacol_006615 [Clathrus columnatus]